MRRTMFSVTFLLLLTLPVFAQVDKLTAADEINEGAKSYKAGNFVDARRHFENALKLEPTLEKAPIFLARSIHAQYKPGVDQPENIAIAREAIMAYRAVLDKYPDNDDAYNSVAFLYGAIGDEAAQIEWIEERANRGSLTAEKRSEAFIVLASKKWDCSFKITELKENQETVEENGKVIIRFLKPKDESQFVTAQQCAEQGIDLIEKAINLNPESESAWSYKTNILREKAKLAEMLRQQEERDRINKEVEEAQHRTNELADSGKQKRQ